MAKPTGAKPTTEAALLKRSDEKALAALTHYDVGNQAFDDGNLDEAIWNYERACEAVPGFVDAASTCLKIPTAT